MSPWVRKIEGGGNPKPSVAVIGAGIGGLTAAYELMKQGFKVTVYEGSARVGGRIMSDYDSFGPQQQFCEKGGEWIDSTHHAIHKLARELKLEIQDISKKRTGEDLFYFGKEFYAPADFIKYHKGQSATEGAFIPLARYIGRDKRRARDNPAYARKLDATDMASYLHQAQADTKAPYWVINSILAAYKGEFGTEPSEQSAMLLINQIGTSMNRPFEVYGPKQDESQRIKGGNQKLIEGLKDALEAGGVKIYTGHKLKKIDYRPELKRRRNMVLEFEHDDKRRTWQFDYAVCAIPFTKLREVEGLSSLAERGYMTKDKLAAIKELGYGNITKIMLGMNGRPWENHSGFPSPANGSFRSDNPYLQNTWITSVGQKGQQDSILTILVAGHEAKQPPPTIMRECKKAAAELFGMSEDALFNRHNAFHVWPRHEFVKGSYSAMRPGQYTHMRLITGTPELEGHLGFAGEHCDPELFGYMNGAVASGLKEAQRMAEMEKAITLRAAANQSFSSPQGRYEPGPHL